MIYCLNCGKGIPDQSKFCTFCGTAIAVQTDQSNVPSQTTPPAQQYVNPAPPLQQTVYTNPPVQQYVTPQPVTTKNEFYKNAGFWGAVLAFVGFFLPYVNGVDVSFYYLVSDLAPDKPELYMYLVFPIAGAILIIQGLTGMLPSILVAVAKIVPLLLLVLLIVGATQSDSGLGFMGSDFGTILSNIGIGLYMTVIGTILMLFFKTTKARVRRV